MIFNPKTVAFGRHETFPLRYSWLTKGFQALLNDPKIFESPDATVTLGVGKNMVNAIRFWLQAAQVVEKTPKGLFITPVGEAIFNEENGGYDPYLEDEATLWLLHWLLATNPSQATAWYWFFNQFHKPEFTSQEASTALLDFAKQNITAKFSAGTVKQDATILLRMYVRSKGNTRTPLEEALDSPFSLLGLVAQAPGGKSFQSRPGARDGLPLGVLGFAVTQLMQLMGSQQLPIEDLMYSKTTYPAPGAVFRLTESALLTKLEQLIHVLPGTYEMRETAGIHQLYLLEDIKPLAYLERHYHTDERGVAA